MLAPREIDEYLLPTERRVIRVRYHWASVWKDLTLTALFVLAMVVVERYLPDGVLVDTCVHDIDVARFQGRRVARVATVLA